MMNSRGWRKRVGVEPFHVLKTKDLPLESIASPEDASGLLDAFIGGWQFSGLGRWTSGLPFGVEQSQWSTNWNYNSYMVQTGRPVTPSTWDGLRGRRIVLHRRGK